MAHSLLQCVGHHSYDVALQLEDDDEMLQVSLVDIKKKCGNKDAFYSNASTVERPVAKRIRQQCLLNPISLPM